MMAQALARRLPWVTSTPLGVEVEPEVNCRKQMSSAVTCAGSCATPSGAGPRSSSATTTPFRLCTFARPLHSTCCSLALVAM